MIEFKCHKCRERIDVADAHAGRTISCPRCQTSLEVPYPQAVEEDVDAASPELDDELPQRDWAGVSDMLEGLDHGTDLEMATMAPPPPASRRPGVPGAKPPVRTTVTHAAHQGLLARLKNLIAPTHR